MIVSTQFVPKGFSAFCVWPFIFVRPEQRKDAFLLEHEMVHYREQISYLGLSPVAMLLFTAFLIDGDHLWVLWQIPVLVMLPTFSWIAHYLLSRKFRFDAEVRAYRRQIELGGVTPAQAAQALLNYRLGITLEKAIEALSFK
jgi:hypothetical protein